MPMIAATAAMVSGVREKGRAAAAGMINMAVINNAPTTLIATAPRTASASVSTSCYLRGSRPPAVATSEFSVAISSADHRTPSISTTAMAPSQITARSVVLTARMSPKR